MVIGLHPCCKAIKHVCCVSTQPVHEGKHVGRGVKTAPVHGMEGFVDFVARNSSNGLEKGVERRVLWRSF